MTTLKDGTLKNVAAGKKSRVCGKLRRRTRRERERDQVSAVVRIDEIVMRANASGNSRICDPLLAATVTRAVYLSDIPHNYSIDEKMRQINETLFDKVD